MAQLRGAAAQIPAIRPPQPSIAGTISPTLCRTIAS
jgi:hypothetical protein